MRRARKVQVEGGGQLRDKAEEMKMGKIRGIGGREGGTYRKDRAVQI